MSADHAGLLRLLEVMSVLRQRCPWDAEQTHRSLVPYLVEEACEVVEAIETDDPVALREELGDLLLQVVFHAQIAAERPDGFDVDDVATGIADKLVARHPHVFADEVAPADLNDVWEQRKAVEKGRTSALDGIPQRLSALSRAAKVIGRSSSHGVAPELPSDPIDADELGRQIVGLVARGKAAGIDAEQAVRDAVRDLEDQVRRAESS